MSRESLANGELQAVRKQVQALDANGARLSGAVHAFEGAIAPLAEGEGTQAPLNLSAIGGELTSLQADLEGSDAAPTAPQRALYADEASRLQQALVQWEQIKAHVLPVLDAALRAAGKPGIKVSLRAQRPAVDAGVSREIP
jgi:hypothetical protein